MSSLLTILFGVFIISVLVPVMQFFDRGSLPSDVQLDAPNPFGVGILIGFVLIQGLVMLVAKKNWLPAKNILILYLMATIALPMCNVGLVAPMFSALMTTSREKFHRMEDGNVDHIYQWQDPSYAPKLSPEAEQRFENLSDPDYLRENEVLDPKTERIATIKHIRQFFDGKFVDRETKDLYDQPQWGTVDKVKAAWGDIPWEIWGPILMRWGAFATLLLLGTMVLSQVLCRDWIERESLPFPVVQAPLALLMDQKGSNPGLLKNPFLLGGMALAALWLLLSGLAHYKIVELPLEGAVTFQRIDFNAILVREPFSLVKNNYLFLSPLMIGIAYLVHQDILKGSLWVFAALQFMRFLTGQFESSLSSAFGSAWHGNLWPYYPELGTGAAIVFASVLVWRSRSAFTVKKNAGDDFGYIPSRWVIPLSLFVVGGLLLFLLDIGSSGIGTVFVLFMVFVWTFISAVALARCRTEGGLAATGTNLVNNKVLPEKVGWASSLHPDNIRSLVQQEWVTISAFPGMLAAQIEGLYMAKQLSVKPRMLAVAVLTAGICSLSVGLISFVVQAYWLGGLSGYQRFISGMTIPIWNMGGNPANRTNSPVDGLWCAVVIFGAVFMALLLYLRKRYPRFPIPPICFLIITLGTVVFQTGQDNLHPTYSYGPFVCFVWGPMFIAFLAKQMVLRFGGMDLYVRTIPTAHGLVLGQALMIVVWSFYHFLAQPENIGVFTGIFF